MNGIIGYYHTGQWAIYYQKSNVERQHINAPICVLLVTTVSVRVVISLWHDGHVILAGPGPTEMCCLTSKLKEENIISAVCFLFQSIKIYFINKKKKKKQFTL